jgi:hypothetical protein
MINGEMEEGGVPGSRRTAACTVPVPARVEKIRVKISMTM